ncbi:glycosyltransferase [Streptomyces sp. WAC05374]|uniref:bifunctional glycosyltransferase/class I SAM-dependent methyltransferase n=1 Tax=unclassified Streptomyces TaxID=2593676 RepID=UPI000F89029F|nr:bifunctional glycosyltransferase/class I SAM-dependent methyltransferase [Streptomyces sp. WAC05374]RST01164.1 glycosyltransferase [Streptomyces sp. WAC05374]TDF44414.1 glycosyltransferase [Streptomyces sp. WAC05374]TDF44986.1 glycosyltransferase [Streptomyces sp. WAC05374]TDF58489.1 glycosyltransferase [Streptomyces sp. WAC05374]
MTEGRSSSTTGPRIGVLVVAYNAETTLEKTLDRIPADFRPRIAEILILDDASHDATFTAGCRWSQLDGMPPTVVMRHTKNLGYGGNQKAGYALAAERGLDIVVLLHGDGQYAPELLPRMVEPLERGECDAVFGSRMMRPRDALRGGMPLYKWLGNRILTRLENRLLGSRLTEFHSGYRAYRVDALRRLPIERNTDAFDFDTQIIVQMADAGMRIREIPIPTYYGDEICYVNGMRYAKDVVKDVLEYRLAKKGFGTCGWIPKPVEYDFKEGDGSSHAVILDRMRDLPPGRVLDVGCSGGAFAERLEALGHTVTGIDRVEVEGVHTRCTGGFFLADLEEGLPEGIGDGYDYVVAGDVIEHLSRPERLLAELRRVLRPDGHVLLSVPNFGHWYSRLRVALGIFDYDRRGILDETHLRFFSRASLRRTVRAAGYDVLSIGATGAPFWSVLGGGPVSRVLGGVSKVLTRLRPTLFGYQYVALLTPHAARTIIAGEHIDVQDILNRQFVPVDAPTHRLGV